ncbi:MAG: type II secretion system protein GspC [Thermodesulfobacteriota bacterium]|nr:type II secretion system protein GspC [Thermodesulfobacteriota bacterium]
MIGLINNDTLKPLVVGINMLLIAMAVYAGVDLFYAVTGNILAANTPVAVVEQADSRSSQSSGRKRPEGYSAIASRNIFQAASVVEEETQPEIDVDSLKKTDLDLRLLGTIAGMGDDSYAVIEDTRKHDQNLYKVGDAIDSATVKLILRKKVVLTINGTDEVLEMEEGLASLGGHQKRRRADRISRPPLSRSGSRAGRVRNVTLNRSEVETAFDNVNDLMRKVRIRPHFSDGKPDGLSLDSVAAGSIFSDMGLQSKDVIVGVNGKQISTVDDCMAVYRSMSSESDVMLEVKRNGRREFIQYNIR